MRSTLNRARFQDCAPREVYAALLEDDTSHCSVPAMYRILRETDEVRERRDQLRHPAYTKPGLLATGPNQVWTWDITKLLGPAKWTYYYLYVVLALFSRKVVGWMVAGREAAELAEQLVTETCVREGIPPDQLTLHADRGSAMIAKFLVLLLIDLGVRDSHSRPHVSNDNPYSEAQFKTLKYHPTFPTFFGSLGRRAHLGSDVLYLVQRSASSHWPGSADPERGACRSGRSSASPAPSRAPGGLCRPSGA